MSLKLEYNKLQSTNKKQENELQSLNAHLNELTDKEMKDAEKIDAIEQHGRRKNLKIAGVLMKNDKDTNKLVIEVAKLLQVAVAPEHILTSHRLSLKLNSNGEKIHLPLPLLIVLQTGISAIAYMSARN